MDLFSQAQEKVKRKVEDQKTRGVKEIVGIVEAIRHAGQHLRGRQKDVIAHYTDRAADNIDRAIQYVELRDVSELLKEAQCLARRHPEAFWGGAFMLGLLAARFLKSSNEPVRRDLVSARKKERATIEPMSTTV
ncbi:MAG: hypothetical protein ABIU05_06845 [Nitrospirales bacterium]